MDILRILSGSFPYWRIVRRWPDGSSRQIEERSQHALLWQASTPSGGGWRSKHDWRTFEVLYGTIWAQQLYLKPSLRDLTNKTYLSYAPAGRDGYGG